MLPTTAELIRGRRLGELLDHRFIDLVGEAAPQRVARVCVRRALDGRASSEHLDDAVLVADELVGNAIEHTVSGPLSLSLDIYETTLVLQVTDADEHLETVPPGPIQPVLDGTEPSEGGRGLFLVDQLAAFWAVESTADGKAVMAVIDLGGGDA